MILDTLNHKIKEMKSLRRLEFIKANKAQQDAVDGRYRLLISQINQNTQVLSFLNSDTGFKPSDETAADYSKLFEQLKVVISAGLADNDELKKAEQMYKSIHNSLKKEWPKFFNKYTNSTLGTLKVISGIDPITVSSCIYDIQTGAVWGNDLKSYKQMVKGMQNAGALIEHLKLDQKIVVFLQKMNSGKATLEDLNDDVLSWIRIEALERKIRLTFGGK